MLLKTCEHGNGLGMCWMCQLTTIKDLEADLKESRLLYKEAKERATQLRNILTDERAVIIRLTLANDELKAKLERYETVLKLFEEYFEFLNTANQGPITIAYNHGWRATGKDIEKGKEYRKKLGIGEFKPAQEAFQDK